MPWARQYGCSRAKMCIRDSPTFNKRYTDPFNAKEFAEQMIKHNYRDGWELPAMPK